MSDTTRLDETLARLNSIIAERDVARAEVERLRDREAALIRAKDADLDDARDEIEDLRVERDAALAEVEVLRAELREATKSTLGWRQWVMRGRDAALAENAKLRELLGIDQWSREIEPANIREIAATEVRKLASQQRDEAEAERDAALAAVTAVRDLCDQLVAERSTAGAGVIANRIRAALGTVGQPREDPNHG